MSGSTIRRCGKCGTPLPARDRIHRRCEACAQADMIDRDPVWRGVKPPDFPARVRRGCQLAARRRQLLKERRKRGH